ncbi:MAG: right-handed parallel beta-helix repeat-containing protein [Fibromonadales bacterium]|nr:right-handed parallel beta-helix repeat-containing protein [Fibromonadales bacterium]
MKTKLTKLTAIFLAVSAIAAYAEDTEQLKKTIIGYGFKVDAAGNTITIKNETENVPLKRSDNKTLTLDIPAGITVNWQAKLTAGNVYNELIVKKGKGTLEIRNGSIGNSIVNSLYNAIRVDEGDLTIYGGTISSGVGYGIKSYSTGTVAIKGGTISMRGGPGISVGVYNASIGTVEISGGTISADYAVYNVSTGTVNISGGTIKAIGGKAIYGFSSGGTINISGGEISSNDEDGGTVVSSVGKINIFSPAKITSK